MDKIGSMGKSLKIMTGVLLLSILVALLWDHIGFVKESIHAILDPTIGALLNWNLTIGMLIIVFFITLFTTIIQKYTTDQKTLRELREKQKKMQVEIKKHRQNPQKMMELQKESLPDTFKIMELSFRSTIFTIIPLVLLFRWFMDYFILGQKFFGFMGWIWFYLISAIVFSIILRKALKVV